MNAQEHALHCNRVRWHAVGVHVLVSFALLWGALWYAMQATMCWNGRVAASWQMACDWLFVVPDLAFAAAVGVAVALVYRLWEAGRSATGTKPLGMAAHMDHARAGYRAMPEVRPHVKASAATVCVGAGLLVGGALFYFFYLEAWVGFLAALLLATATYLTLRELARGKAPAP